MGGVADKLPAFTTKAFQSPTVSDALVADGLCPIGFRRSGRSHCHLLVM